MSRLSIIVLGVAALAGCDYTGDFLFSGPIDGKPGVIDLGVVPVADPSDGTAIVYGEVGPAEVGAIGGATVRFEGTGGNVCVWVDPEAVTWNTAVAPSGDVEFAYPDNVEDDGDLDIEVGQSIFYTGSVGQSVGDFEASYIDHLGNPIQLSLNQCQISDLFGELGAHSGRAAPEYCVITNTIPNLEYTVAISTWTTPLNDDLLSFGVMIADGGCDGLKEAMNVTTLMGEECLIPQESRVDGVVRPGFDVIEMDFCMADEDGVQWETLAEYCNFESQLKDCLIDDCFCGDPTDLPEAL